MLVLLNSDSTSASSSTAAHPSAAHQQRLKCMQSWCAPSYGIASMRMQTLPQRRISWNIMQNKSFNRQNHPTNVGNQIEQVVSAIKTAHTTLHDTSAFGNATPAPRRGRGAGPHKSSHRRRTESHYKFGVHVCPYKLYKNYSETRQSYSDI